MTNDSAGKHAPIPLVKRLVAAGMGSRRKAAALIMSGVVAVNGERALNLNHPVSNADVVTVKGARTAQAEERRVYLLLNKPKDYLSTVTDSRGRPTILHLIPPAFRVAGLVPAGRLDAESTGLMLLTNDGPLVDRITHPRYGVVKEYDVLLDKQLSPSDRRRLTDGIEIESGLATALSVTENKRGDPRYAIELTEGKKREVRLMMRALGRRVLRLTRVRIGGLLLGTLAPGAVREISERDARKAADG